MHSHPAIAAAFERFLFCPIPVGATPTIPMQKCSIYSGNLTNLWGERLTLVVETTGMDEASPDAIDAIKVS